MEHPITILVITMILNLNLESIRVNTNTPDTTSHTTIHTTDTSIASTSIIKENSSNPKVPSNIPEGHWYGIL